MGVKDTVLADGQPPTVAFTVAAQLCGPKANETEMGAAPFTKNGEGRNFDMTCCSEKQQNNWGWACALPVLLNLTSGLD